MAAKETQDARIFYADTRFERMARRPGGLEKDKALALAQVQVDELKPEFNDWLDRELHELGLAFSRIKDDSSDGKSFNHAYFSCTQLRDVGATMDLQLVTFVADNLCEILDAFNAGGAYDPDMIDCHMKALLLARTEPYRHLSPNKFPEMSDGLRYIVELASIVPGQTNN